MFAQEPVRDIQNELNKFVLDIVAHRIIAGLSKLKPQLLCSLTNRVGEDSSEPYSPRQPAHGLCRDISLRGLCDKKAVTSLFRLVTAD